MKLYLMEAHNANMQFEDGIVVALTPEVCYNLDKERVEYTIIEDYYNECELFGDRNGFLDDQSKWFKTFDEFLKNNANVLNEHDLNLASMYSMRIKSMVVDPIIFKSITLKALFDKLNPSNVTFVALPPEEKVLDVNLGYTDKSLYAHLIPILCEKHSIPFTEQFGKSMEIAGGSGAHISKKISRIVKYIPGLFEMLCAIFNKTDKKKVLDILQMNFAYNGFDAVKNSFIRGHNAYIFTNGKIIKLYRFGFKRFDIEHDGDTSEYAPCDWNRIAQLLETHELVEWINEKYHLDVSDIVLPNLKYFVSEVCPELLKYHNTFSSFFEDESIDVVLSPYMQSIMEIAAISAANGCNSTMTICLEHGDDIFRNVFWRLKELTNFDTLIVSSDENKQYLERIRDHHDVQTNIYSCLNRMSYVSKINELRMTKKFERKIKLNKNKIIYVPTFFKWDAMRVDEVCQSHLTPTQYYKFQISLLEHFSKKEDYTFIWKALSESEPIYNPIPNLIQDNKINNVRIATDPFQNYLPTANKVIFDYPSTGMYESVVAGVPTMCLCSDTLKVRESGLDEFKNVIKIYSNIEEAINYIEQFLSGDPEQYKVSLKLGNRSLIDMIESECKI